VEATSALMLVQLCLRHGLTLRWVALSYMALSILVLVPIDWKHGILPDLITIPGAVVGLVLSFFTSEPGRVDAMLGAAVGGLVPLTIRALYMGWVGMRSRLGTLATPDGPPLHAVSEPMPPPPIEAAAVATAAGLQKVPAEAEEEGNDERREGLGLGDVKMLMMSDPFSVWPTCC